MNTTTAAPTMTQQFQAEYAKGLVPAMLKAMKDAHTAAMVLLGASLAVTYFHVAAYLSARPAFGLLGWVLPLIIDGGLMVLFHVLTVRALNTASKVMAGIGAAFAAYLSVTLNWTAAAEDPMAARMYAGIVAFAIFIKATAAVMGPNFTAMAKAEQAVAVVDAAPVITQTDMQAYADAAVAAALAQAAIDAQAAITAAVDAAEKRVDRRWTAKLARERKAAETAAPVSPAPAPGPLSTGLIVPTAADLAEIYAR